MIPQILIHAPQMYGLRTDWPNAGSRQYPTNAPVEVQILLFDPATATVLWRTTTRFGECEIRGLESREYQVVGIRMDNNKWLAQSLPLTAKVI